ncbi:MAG: hypothetical protein AAF561_16800 [Planctomycetota bacterium]
MSATVDRYTAIVKDAACRGRPTRRDGLFAGLVLCDAIEGVTSPKSESADDADEAGHRRPVYATLARYARALAARLRGESLAFESRTRAFDQRPDAAVADRVVADVFDDLTHLVGDPSAEAAALRSLVRHQDDAGRFFAFDGQSGDNPEPWWYHELVATHAVTSFARLTGDEQATHASNKAAAFHHAETQADHASDQPWAVHAFLAEAESIPTAELLLVAAGVGRRDLGVVSRLILADAAVWLDADLTSRARV